MMAFKECLVAIILMTVVSNSQGGISVHKIKGQCTDKFHGKPSANDDSDPSSTQTGKDQCMKCFCDKGGESMTCFGCSPSYITIEEQMALLDKHCYLSKAGELPQYPTCCRNTIVCEEGINSKYFTKKRYEEFQADLQPFVEMYTFLQFLKSAREPMMSDHQPDDVDYFAPHRKIPDQGELLESPLLEKVDDTEFVLPAQQQKTVDKSMFIGQSQMQHEAPAIDFLKPSQYQMNKEIASIESLSEPSGRVEEPAAPPKRKPVKSLRKIYRKPAALVLEENEDHVSYDDIKAARKERRQRKFLRKFHKTRASKVASANTKQKAGDKVGLKTSKPRKIGFAPIIHFKDDILASHGSANTKNVEQRRTVNAKSPKFAPIPSDIFEDNVEHVKQHKVPGFAPIPDFELDEPLPPVSKVLSRKQPAPSAKYAPLPDYDFEEFAKGVKAEDTKQHSVAKPEVGDSLLMDLQFIQIPEKPEDLVQS